MIQIDMEMPRSCSVCPFSTNDEITDTVDCSFTDAWIDYMEACVGRKNNCPLKEVPNNSGWISVKDHYPTATTEYQVALSTGGVIGAWWFNGEKDFIVRDTVITNNVTHWAPLLKHPKE